MAKVIKKGNVTLRQIVTYPEVVKQSVYDKVKEVLQSQFPMDTGKYIVKLSNLTVVPRELSHAQQKTILMAKGNASDSVFADITVFDKAKNKDVVHIKKHKILNIPFFTNRYTFIVDGNEYNIVNQLRTKSGVYTRRKDNDELESSFNLEKGANFKLIMDPKTGVFKLNILHSTLLLYPVLRILGADDAYIKSQLGAKLFLANSTASQAQMDRAINTLYTKLVQYKTALGDTASKEEKIKKVREYFAGTKLNPETTKITLGTPYTSVGFKTIIDAAKKILRVFNNKDEVDARDNLEFQKVFGVEDIIGEIIQKSSKEFMRIRNRLDDLSLTGSARDKELAVRKAFSPSYLSKSIRNFITTSSISRLPSQINPMEIIDTASTVTRLGEGAISSETAVPEETRAVNYSYLGTIDPIATPESSKIGIDNRFSIGAIKGSDGELYRNIRNMRTKKMEHIRIIDLYDKYVGFPDPVTESAKNKKPSDIVSAVYRGKLVKVKRSQLDYQVDSPHDMHTVTTNSLPFVNASQANRLVMGSKHLQQAMPLKYRQKRLVEAVIPSAQTKSTMDTVGAFLLPKSPVDGVVTKIDDDFIYIKGDDKKTYKVDYENNIPLASKTLINNTITVKVGDRVKAGELLADNNFTVDKKLALGTSLKTAYMAVPEAHEDGSLISESAAKKLTSIHSDKVSVTLDKLNILSKSKFTAYFPTTFTKEQLNKLDDSGVAKEGVVLEKGDPIILILTDNSDSKTNQVLGRLHKSLMNRYRDSSKVYDESYPAEVVSTYVSGRTITVSLRIEKPAQRGDKITGSHGDKSTITRIVPDDQMYKDEQGNPIDVILTPASVPGRINPSQILDASLSKVAKKRGKPYKLENFSKEDYISFVKDEGKKHEVKFYETVTDPTTGKKIPNIFIGERYTHKGFKTTDSNFSGRGIDGPYDQDDNPVGSGMTGPKALGTMEVNALVAHNARNFLKDSTMVRGSKNTEFWKRFQYGGMAQYPSEKPNFNKFTSILRQAGVKVEKRDNDLITSPLTDKDVLDSSSGEISNASRLNYKLEPEKGGLFDLQKTGGLGGEKWAHIKLAEPVINPIFEDSIKSILRWSTRELSDYYKKYGGTALRKKLNSIDVNSLYKQAVAETHNKKLTGDQLDRAVKRAKFLRTLKERNLKAGDAYMLKYFPVTPPKIRPITVGAGGDLMENDANILYRDLILQNNSFKGLLDAGLDDEDLAEARENMLTRTKEITGMITPTSAHAAGRGIKGAIKYLSGDVPKEGFFQRKLIYTKMNNSGRATISPDSSLGLDEIGMPIDMAWNMYKPFVIRKLTSMGYSVIRAKEEVEERTDLARQVLQDEVKNRPVILNRAPTLWRYGILGAKPVLREGKTLAINPLWEKPLGQDYDGDAETVHLPITDKAIDDVKNMLPSKLISSSKRRGDILFASTQEPIVGLYMATKNIGKPKRGIAKKFKSVEDAWKAYYSGTLKPTDLVDIG